LSNYLIPLVADKASSPSLRSDIEMRFKQPIA
jgi:hypothetical protein